MRGGSLMLRKSAMLYALAGFTCGFSRVPFSGAP